MANRFIIGKGEVLTYEIPPPKSGGPKKHPYTYEEAISALIPQVNELSRRIQNIDDSACPDQIATAKVTLHPTYLAKSYFPSSFLRYAGLASVGSRTVKISPRKDLRKRKTEKAETPQIFVAGTKDAFRSLSDRIQQMRERSTEGHEFIEIETIDLMTPTDRMRMSSTTKTANLFEVGIHLVPNLSVDMVRNAFISYANKCGFDVALKYEFQVGGLLFLPVSGNYAQVNQLAEFTLMRVIRPMPTLRSVRPPLRMAPLAINFKPSTVQPLSSEPSVAILDGGLPASSVISPYVKSYHESDETSPPVEDYLNHGLGVTSAFLFGPLEADEVAPRPFSYVDHFRVLDAQSDNEDPYELYRTLGHVEEVLLSRQHQFVNLSLGPDRPVEDDDVHAWTAVIDSLLSDGETLLTVAVGNNGERDSLLGFDRIQTPSDCVNALSVGAANKMGVDWARAAYSARGPGRSPGIRKPDLLGFGGSPKEYFHVPVSGEQPGLVGVMGTSFSAPYVLRTAVGIRSTLGDEVHPLTIKALLIHTAQKSDVQSPLDEGWGLARTDINQIITCGDGVVRILYQGQLRPGKYLRAPVPLPLYQLNGTVNLSATFCYASPVDVQDTGSYTKAGLKIFFRPHIDRAGKNEARAKTFFSGKEFRTEQEQRSDLGKWETVLHATHSFDGTDLKGATFDVHYNARDGGGPAPSGSELIKYALVLTVEANAHPALYEDILEAHGKLKAIEPKISMPINL